MLLRVILLALLPCSLRLSAQGLSTNRVESSTNAPLVIAQRAPAGMPIRVLAGANGSVRALEIDGVGGTWIRGPLSIGALTGAQSNELVRISGVPDMQGKGLTISLQGTSSSSGLVIQDVGASGSDHAALVISSVANGSGTGIRLGGPQGGTRPALGTGIDVTGGTGIRYNALSAGTGIAVDIGGTAPPRRGVETVTSGTDNAGVVAHANTLGVGVIGSSRSIAFPVLGTFQRIGVVGHSATNSAVGADSSTGVFGIGLRGGTAGSATVTIGVHGLADLRTGTSTGTAIGILGRVQQSEAFSGLVVGGMFRSPEHGFALVTEGDIYLGSADDERPVALTRPALRLVDTRTTTFMYDLNASGVVVLRNVTLPPPNAAVEVQPQGSILDCTSRTAQRIAGDVDARLIGLMPTENGRVVMVCNVGHHDVIIVHNSQDAPEQQRISLSGEIDSSIKGAACTLFWYDGIDHLWRRVQ